MMAGLNHRMFAATLARLLAEVPHGWSVQPNAVGNLALLDETGAYAGYIDLGDEMVALFWGTRRKDGDVGGKPVLVYGRDGVEWDLIGVASGKVVRDAEVSLGGEPPARAELVLFEPCWVTVVADGTATPYAVAYEVAFVVDHPAERIRVEATTADGRRLGVSWAYPAPERTASPAGE